MPALRLFGRRWLVAEDDVPLWLILPVIFQLIELILLITWLALAQPQKSCPENINGNRVAFEVATFGLLATLAIVVFCESWISIAALRGSIFEQKKRASVRPLLECTLLTYVVQLGFNVLLTVLLYDEPIPCTRGKQRSRNIEGVLFALAWTTWGTVIGIAVLGAWFFNFFPNYMDSSSWSKDYMRTAWLCCSCSMIQPKKRKRQRHKSIHIGQTLASLFGHIDYTRSDFIVSFYLAMVMQRCKREKAAKAKALHAADDNDTDGAGEGPSNGANGFRAVAGADATGITSDADLESGQLVDVETLKDAVHFFRHAFAVYGWDLYVLHQGLICGVPKVCCTAGRKSGDPGCGALPGFVTPWRLNFKVAEEVLSIGKQNMLFYRDAGERVDVVPYIISVDVEAKAIVLALRGATTLDDNALDLMLNAANLDTWLDPGDAGGASWEDLPPEVRRYSGGDRYAAHTGYLMAARATLADVQEEGVLRAALDGPTARFPDYKLVVVGHSLGAAMAFLISLRLRHLVPGLKCYCFSVPGCVASREVCAAARDWCTTIAFGQEFVPRYSAANLDRMRDEMVMAAARCRKTKTTVVLWWIFGWFCGKPWKEDELFYSEDQIPDEVKALLRQYRDSLDGDIRRQELLQRTADLTLPGRLIYIRETSVEKVPRACCGKKTVRKYQAEWKDPTEFLAEGIRLDTRLLLDHLPNISFGIMTDLVEDDNDDGEHVSKERAPAKIAVVTQAISL